MNEKNLIILLKTIHQKENMRRLQREALSFSQIVSLTEQAVDANLITYLDSKISLTKEGIDFLERNIERFKKINKDEWIELDFENKIKRFPKNDIFLPDRSEFSFLD